MKISEIYLKAEVDGIKAFRHQALGDIVLLTGGNGSGKTRLLKCLETYIQNLNNGNDDERIELKISDKEDYDSTLDSSNVQQIQIVNYSHYDAYLQSPNDFTPYVIHKAKNILKTCDYQETALNALLLLYDMAQGYSTEFKDRNAFNTFKDTIKEKFHIDVSINEDGNKVELEIFNRSIDKACLSPGQQYLLRMAVACQQNQPDAKQIFLLDEPELHLHPKALIDIVCHLRETFKGCQFWISTHSLPLIAYLSATEQNTTIFNLTNGKVDLFRSNSEHLLEGLLGNIDNRVAVQMILSTPDEYASNKFSIECYDSAQTSGAKSNDPQIQTVAKLLKPNDLVVDYGAGQGRFFEGLAIDFPEEDVAKQIKYFAYDPCADNAAKCKYIMKKHGSREENYFNHFSDLKDSVKGTADYVLLVNVLHEIDPKHWLETFQNINELLKKGGKLIIVERNELTIGEAPYENRFLVITQNSANELFGKHNIHFSTHPQKAYIEKYVINKKGLHVTQKKLLSCLQQIQKDSYLKLKELKNTAKPINRYKNGLKLAFWLNQYANSILSIEDLS